MGPRPRTDCELAGIREKIRNDAAYCEMRAPKGQWLRWRIYPRWRMDDLSPTRLTQWCERSSLMTLMPALLRQYLPGSPALDLEIRRQGRGVLPWPRHSPAAWRSGGRCAFRFLRRLPVQCAATWRFSAASACALSEPPGASFPQQ